MGVLGFFCFQFMIRNTTIRVEQTVDLLSAISNGLLSLVWIIALIYGIKKVFQYTYQKTTENDIANAVVEKILPILLEHQKADKSNPTQSEFN